VVVRIDSGRLRADTEKAAGLARKFTRREGIEVRVDCTKRAPAVRLTFYIDRKFLDSDGSPKAEQAYRTRLDGINSDAGRIGSVLSREGLMERSSVSEDDLVEFAVVKVYGFPLKDYELIL